MKLFAKAFLSKKDKLFIASDEVEDRQGEVISQDGWDLSNFKKNPVIQWAHNDWEPAIATAENIGFRTIEGKKRLTYKPKFHRKTPMSNYIADLVEEGIIKASSVGFKPIEQEENKYTKAELLEISFVNVPANQNALALGVSKGYSTDVIKTVMPSVKEAEIKKLESENKAVISYKKYPLSTADTWDASSETKEADTKDLKSMSAWYDSEKPDVKSSYKLPHHELSGYKTNWKGVTAAMAALMGARGGVDIPEADRRAVYNHLAKHYKDFDKEAPEFKSADEIVEKYVENKSADEKIIELTKSVNTFMEEKEAEIKERKEIANSNTEKFQEAISKRFEDIEFNIQGLTEGIKPSDKGLEQRLLDIESHIEKIAADLRSSLSALVDREKTNDQGKAKPVQTDSRRLAIKSLNKIVEILNKSERKQNG